MSSIAQQNARKLRTRDGYLRKVLTRPIRAGVTLRMGLDNDTTGVEDLWIWRFDFTLSQLYSMERPLPFIGLWWRDRRCDCHAPVRPLHLSFKANDEAVSPQSCCSSSYVALDEELMIFFVYSDRRQTNTQPSTVPSHPSDLGLG